MTIVSPVTYCPSCDCPHTERFCPRCGYSVVEELNELLAEDGEPATCLEEVERWRVWQAENMRRGVA